MRRTSHRSGTAAVEFAIIAVPFLAVLMLTFELAYDLFAQTVLDRALQSAARQVQTGQAQNLTSATFLSTILCPALDGALSCASVYVKIQRILPTATQDYFDFTTGTPTITNGQLDLSSYSGGSFCNSGPAELLLVSAIYVGPSFLGLVSSTYGQSFAGQTVHATLSTVGVVTESYTPGVAAAGVTPAPSC